MVLPPSSPRKTSINRVKNYLCVGRRLMMRSSCRWAVVTAIAVLAVPAGLSAQPASRKSAILDPDGVQRLKAATGGAAQVSISDLTGAARFVSMGDGTVGLAPSLRAADPE